MYWMKKSDGFYPVDAFWLYIVEYATDPENARVLVISEPCRPCADVHLRPRLEPDRKNGTADLA